MSDTSEPDQAGGDPPAKCPVCGGQVRPTGEIGPPECSDCGAAVTRLDSR